VGASTRWKWSNGCCRLGLLGPLRQVALDVAAEAAQGGLQALFVVEALPDDGYGAGIEADGDRLVVAADLSKDHGALCRSVSSGAC